jgi:hydroxylamine reductase
MKQSYKAKECLMETKMFCHQCQETVGNKGCTVAGVCGKDAEVAALQDVLVYVTRGLAKTASRLREQGKPVDKSINHLVSFNLFVTITNANFDGEAIVARVLETVAQQKTLLAQLGSSEGLSEAELWAPQTKEEMLQKAPSVGVLATSDDDIRSLRWLIIFGLKGMAAYDKHANTLGYDNEEIDAFLQVALAKTLDDSLTVEDLIALTLETGKYGVDVMALLDQANTSTYGNPELTTVELGVRSNPAILISGHDLRDLEMLLEQTEGSGVDVYTHSEMLPAHYYPAFKKYSHFVGNYGNAWWKQKEEFESFNGPILLTTNCLVPPKASYKDRVYTTSAVGFEGCKHIEGGIGEKKDFSAIIEHAKRCAPPTEIETGQIIGGFAHNQVFALADKVVDAVNSGAIKKFVVMAGCDGRVKGRSYYTEFAEALPSDTVILTAGCAKYRYNKLNLGDIGGIPRVLDAGQCNDSYSLAVIALKLKEVFGLSDVNDLPIVYNIAWYEQKAVIVLLALLSLGVKNIHLGPTLPAFLSPNVANVLVENFGIAGIGSVEDDIKLFFGEEAATTGAKITADMIIGDILRLDQDLSKVLIESGMACIGCPSSQSESLADACAVHGIAVEPVLDKLNAAVK